MSTKTQDALIDALADLGRVYPDLRFGQLIEMVALLAAEVTPMSATAIDDDQLLNTASDHARTRREQLKTEDNSLQEWHSPEFRTELLDVLHRVREQHRDRRFGHLVSQLATFSGSSLYDVEDGRLLAAARNHPVG